ncbi:MAG: sulfide/dihydroorotate dehydrogenase-like FAD/NAD-binding protein [Candidatus Omnitrophica bacterium]|nr:sulfide/dihydroorotate dehydrogenase-like FAD/NAD-binding protein [Candidatus Omnitrophota bacterium]
MRIIRKEILARYNQIRIILLEIDAPEISKKALPGQFVVLMVKREGERIPLTIVDKNIQKGTITLIFQEVGLTTRLLGKLDCGDSLYALVGPLGRPTEIKNYGEVIIIGGGVGIAEIYPVAGAFKKEGNFVFTILGARTKELLILEERLREISDEFYITTDDGTYGRKGFVSDVLEEILNSKLKDEKFQLIYAVGPISMMRRVSEITKPYNIKTVVSLNALMVDATGMCGCCRVNIAGEIRFSCVDGPEFDAHLVDWENLLKRNSMYLEKEKHICNLLLEK